MASRAMHNMAWASTYAIIAFIVMLYGVMLVDMKRTYKAHTNR